MKLQAQSSRASTWRSERTASLRTLGHWPTTHVVSYSAPHVSVVIIDLRLQLVHSSSARAMNVGSLGVEASLRPELSSILPPAVQAGPSSGAAMGAPRMPVLMVAQDCTFRKADPESEGVYIWASRSGLGQVAMRCSFKIAFKHSTGIRVQLDSTRDSMFSSLGSIRPQTSRFTIRHLYVKLASGLWPNPGTREICSKNPARIRNLFIEFDSNSTSPRKPFEARHGTRRHTSRFDFEICM